MRIGFVIFDGMTTLDFVGMYDPLTRLRTTNFLPDFSWEVCARTAEIRDVAGLRMGASSVAADLGQFDLVAVPGGIGVRALLQDDAMVDWIKSAAACRWKVSVCTGSLLLGAAGFLKGKTATTHPAALDELRPFASRVVRERVVEDGDTITAGGVSSSLDLGLYLCEKFAGLEVRKKIQLQMDYAYA